jgi:hypothetical protein
MLEVGCAHGPGGDNDPGLSFVEARTHFGAWCIVSSPLILSHDTNNDTISDEIWPIISNTEAIAVNQAWAGESGNLLLLYVYIRKNCFLSDLLFVFFPPAYMSLLIVIPRHTFSVL